MGQKKTAVIGSENEEALKAKKTVKRDQKKMREGKTEKVVAEVAQTANQDSMSTQTESASSEKKNSFKKAHTRSKQYHSLKSAIDVNKTYSTTDGFTLLQKVTVAKFDPSVELHIVLKKPSESKFVLNLPNSTGKTRKVVVATDEVVAQIESGNIDFDVLVTSPAQMGKLVRFAKVLGPRGLMPNPKNGTVSEKPEEAAKKLAADTSVSLKADKTGPVYHLNMGKMSLGEKKLLENISSAISIFPASLLKKVVLKSTHSPAIKIQA